MIDAGTLRARLADLWGLPAAVVEPHHGGMNSATWFVGVDGHRWVAKSVAGIPAGAPVPTRHGDLVADVDGTPLALLRWVSGEELTGCDESEQRLLGRTLARVHEALRGVPVEDADRFHWVDPEAEHLAVRQWIRPHVAAAVAALAALDPGSLSPGVLHTDPAPQAFRLDRATGVCGLIDWSVAMTGPLLYDLASAVMYVGGPDRAGPLVDAYLDGAVVSRAEVERGLLVMLRFRWAVQADYFARRIATGDLTGIAGTADNEAGLEDARRWVTRPDGR